LTKLTLFDSPDVEILPLRGDTNQIFDQS